MRPKQLPLIPSLFLGFGLLIGVPYYFSMNFIPKSCEHDTDAFRCVTVIRTYDAGTFRVQLKGVHPALGDSLLVWVDGVRTPSIHSEDICEKELASEGKKFVTKLLSKTHRIDLKDVRRSQDQRLLANFLLDGEPLKQYLLDKHLALPPQEKSNINWCLPQNT